jgi:hypothetical protein
MLGNVPYVNARLELKDVLEQLLAPAFGQDPDRQDCLSSTCLVEWTTDNPVCPDLAKTGRMAANGF